MEYKKITAIIRTEHLEKVEEGLKKLHVSGITITQVIGYGEYSNLFTSDWTSINTRIEIYTQHNKIDAIVKGIMEAAHTGLSGDGIVVIQPVDHIYRIRTKELMKLGD